MQQLKLRLDEEVVKLLKNQAKLQGIPFNTLCQKILAAASKNEILLVNSDGLGLKLDLVIAMLRSLEKAVNSNK
jgi:hypothetical protein